MKRSMFSSLLCFVFVLLLPVQFLFAVEDGDVPPTILVDSTETLANESGERVYVSYGEWNSDGNYDGWTISNAASSSVSGGVLTATETVGGSAMTIEYSFSSALFSANLDYGYKEFLRIRGKLGFLIAQILGDFS
jgi:hypothetical protein